MVQNPVLSLARGTSYVCPVCKVHDRFRSQQPAFPRYALRHLRLHVHCYPMCVVSFWAVSPTVSASNVLCLSSGSLASLCIPPSSSSPLPPLYLHLPCLCQQAAVRSTALLVDERTIPMRLFLGHNACRWLSQKGNTLAFASAVLSLHLGLFLYNAFFLHALAPVLNYVILLHIFRLFLNNVFIL